MTPTTMDTHKYHFDILRILAILCVIYNHTNKRGYYLYALTDNLPKKCLLYGFSAYVAVAVPIFFMISGALLINRETSLRNLYTRRIPKIAIVLIVFSAIQYAFKFLTDDMAFDFVSFIKTLLSQQIITPYWFLYSYLAFLIILPFLQKLASAMADTLFVYLFILQVVLMGVLPVIYYLFDMSTSHLNLPILNHIIFYPLMGYYIEHRLDTAAFNKKGVLICIIASLFSLCIIIFMSLYRNLPLEQFTPFDKGLFTCELTCIYTIATFYCVKTFIIYHPPGETTKSILHTVGSCVFGLYLIEKILRKATVPVCDYMTSVFGIFPACILWVFLVFILGTGITFLLKKIPGLRELL